MNGGNVAHSLGEQQHIRISPTDPAGQAIGRAARAIKAGGLVAFPTETVYGLGANAWDEAAVDKIFRAKGRPATDPLIAHIAAADQLNKLTRELPELARELARRFWPGALTLVLRKSAAVPARLTAGLDTVAVRMPDHAVARALIEAAGVPIAAPSANRFSRPSPTSAQHVLDDLAEAVDVLLDAGPTSIGLESTIVSLVDDPPRLLRPGGVPLEALRQFMPDLRFEPRMLAEDEAAPAPGSLLKHYSPRAKLLLFHGSDDAAVHAAMRAVIASSRSAGLMLSDVDAAAFTDLDVIVESLGETAEGAALRLFAAMRALDRAGVDLILARAPDKRGLGLAVWDRLLRAAEGAVIEV